LLTPLTETETQADLAAALGLPLVIVARRGLGTLNHTLLTIEVARHRGLRIAGIVLNQAVDQPDDASVATNPQELAARCTVPILGVFPFLAGTDLIEHRDFLTIDWMRLARGLSV
jgi:dethiobiotin synthetase